MLKTYATAALMGISFLLSVTPSVTSKSLESSSKNSKPPVGGAVVDGYKVTATADKKVYKSGEAINLTWTIKNVIKTKVNLAYSSDLSGFRVDILGPHGEKVELTSYGHKVSDALQGGSNAVQVLDPGSESYVKADISQYYEMSLPGKYRIYSSRIFPARGSSDQYVTVTSNPVIVLVKPKSI